MCCVFCDVVKKKKTEFYNMPILETENFIVLADRLPVANVHYSIVSKKHFINVFNVLGSGLLEELRELCNRISISMRKWGYKDILLFEHGQKNALSQTGGKSIDHFHLHIVAEVTGIVESLIKDIPERHEIYSDFSDLFNYKQVFSDYLLIAEISMKQIHIFNMLEGIPSQYLRKRIYEKNHNDFDGYNWKINSKTITCEEYEAYRRILISNPEVIEPLKED